MEDEAEAVEAAEDVEVEPEDEASPSGPAPPRVRKPIVWKKSIIAARVVTHVPNLQEISSDFARVARLREFSNKFKKKRKKPESLRPKKKSLSWENLKAAKSKEPLPPLRTCLSADEVSQRKISDGKAIVSKIALLKMRVGLLKIESE